MKILCLSFVDNGQQLQLLTDAIRGYSTEHDAFHISKKATWLYHDADYYWEEEEKDSHPDIREEVKDADFFILSELLPYDPRMVPLLQELNVHNKITPENTIIRIAGSAVRRATAHYLLGWIREDWMFAGPIYDWSLFAQIGRMAPVDYICPIDKLQEPVQVDDKLRICFAPTRKEKGAAEFSHVMARLKAEYDDIEPVPIQRTSWRESIMVKQRCDITFDQLYIPSYANNCLEGLWLKHAVVSKLADWVYIMRPDIPVLNVKNETEMYEAMKPLIEDRTLLKEIGERGRQFVLDHHTPQKVVKQWELLIEHVTGKD